MYALILILKGLTYLPQGCCSYERSACGCKGGTPGLGRKLNYCLKALKKKGLVKIENFKKNPNKINYFYVLTPAGITEKTKLTLNFMKRKMKEYDELKKELDN